MDKKELLILASLRKESRRSLTRISREIKLPISTIHDRLRDYEDSVIKKTTAIIDFPKVGFKTRAHILLKTEMKDKGTLQEFLVKCSHVNTLARVNNGYDLYCEVIFKDMIEAELFFEILEDKYLLTRKEVFYTLEELKREDFLSSPNLVQMNGI